MEELFWLKKCLNLVNPHFFWKNLPVKNENNQIEKLKQLGF